jgi:hypothetical protein
MEAAAGGQGIALQQDEENAGEILRAIPEHTVTSALLHERLGRYRTRRGESAADSRARRENALQVLARLGFGAIQSGTRGDVLVKTRRTPEFDQLLQRFRVPLVSFPPSTTAEGSPAQGAVPPLLAGGKRGWMLTKPKGQYRYDDFPGRCFQCEEHDHFVKDCPQNIPAQRKPLPACGEMS